MFLLKVAKRYKIKHLKIRILYEDSLKSLRNGN